jgi:hypothetical protein
MSGATLGVDPGINRKLRHRCRNPRCGSKLRPARHSFSTGATRGVSAMNDYGLVEQDALHLFNAYKPTVYARLPPPQGQRRKRKTKPRATT